MAASKIMKESRKQHADGNFVFALQWNWAPSSLICQKSLKSGVLNRWGAFDHRVGIILSNVHRSSMNGSHEKLAPSSISRLATPVCFIHENLAIRTISALTVRRRSLNGWKDEATRIHRRNLDDALLEWLVIAKRGPRLRFPPNLTLHLHYIKSSLKRTPKTTVYLMHPNQTPARLCC
jgi:hypothetical protein